MYKNLLLLLTIYLMVSNITQGQSWNLLQEGKVWKNINWSYDPEIVDMAISGTTAIKFVGDTLVHDTLYKKMYISSDDYQKWSLYGFAREDSKGFYIRNNWQNSAGKEGILYTYNLQVGDQFTIQNCIVDCTSTSEFIYEATVDAIDSVIINGTHKKRYHLVSSWYSGRYQGSEDWIEGIGSLSGIIWPTLNDFITGGSSYLLAYYENDELLYKSPLFDLDEEYYNPVPTSLNKKLVHDKIEVHPNPVKNTIEISGLDYLDRYKIYSINGVCMHQGISNSKLLDASFLKSGIYILELTSGENVYRQKFIKAQ